MLSREDNELITQTNPGTPMGNLIRRYWVPALLSEEIPQNDCPPVRVKLMGEELVAFRDSQGRIGLIGEHCAHRGTSLFFGRNEECGLRCVYHGWKYDVDGNVLETPAEPGGSDFAKKLHHTAYPTHEANGVIYAYLGPREKMPLFPNYEWTQVPLEYSYVTKCLLECNYLQGLEGECDSSHLSFLHRNFTNESNQPVYKGDPAPVYDTQDTDFGVRLIATRNFDDQHYVRFSAFVMPVYGCVPAGRKTNELEGYEIHTYVPADDTHCWRYDIGFHRGRAVRDDEVHRRKQINPDYTKVRNAAQQLFARPAQAENLELYRHRRFFKSRWLRHREHGRDFRPHQRTSRRQRQGGHRRAQIPAHHRQRASDRQGAAASGARSRAELVPAYRLLRPFGAAPSALAKEV